MSGYAPQAPEQAVTAPGAGTVLASRVAGIARRLSGSSQQRRPGLRLGIALLASIILACILVPILSSTPSDAIVGEPYEPPSWAHPFGTDTVGRDLFVRTFEGGRLDLFLAALTIGASLIIGTVIGTLAGASRRRWVDSVAMRIVDAVIAFPFLVLILVLIVVLGPRRELGPLPPGAPAVAGGIILAGWAFYARLSRGQTLALRDRDYVVAARVLGFSHARVVLRHLLPGVVSICVAYAVADAILTIIVIASLSFLGVGIQPPTPEWGSIMYEGRGVLDSAWWITVIPGTILALTGLGLALIADAVLKDRSAVR
jgi:peptide/nickel transport system permease protein